MSNENKELMQFLSDQFQKIDARFDKIEGRLNEVDGRLDKIENRLDVMEVRQNKMAEQLTSLQIAQKQFELSANRKFVRLKDGMDTIMDTIIEILRVNDLIAN